MEDEGEAPEGKGEGGGEGDLRDEGVVGDVVGETSIPTQQRTTQRDIRDFITTQVEKSSEVEKDQINELCRDNSMCKISSKISDDNLRDKYANPVPQQDSPQQIIDFTQQVRPPPTERVKKIIKHRKRPKIPIGEGSRDIREFFYNQNGGTRSNRDQASSKPLNFIQQEDQ